MSEARFAPEDVDRITGERLAIARRESPKTPPAKPIGSDLLAILEGFRPKHLRPGAEAEHAARERTQAQSDAKDRRQERDLRLTKSGIWRRLNVDQRDIPRIVHERDLRPTEALSAARIWLRSAERRPWLIECSLPGRGKTVAAGWCHAERAGRYVTIHDLIRLYQNAHRAAAPETTERALAELDDLRETPFLTLDELGDATDETTRDPLQWLADNRGWRLTLVLCNKSAAELRAKLTGATATLNERTYSRFKTLCHRTPPTPGFPDGQAFWDIGGPDLRGSVPV